MRVVRLYRSAFPIFRGSKLNLSRPSAKSNPPVSRLFPFEEQLILSISQSVIPCEASLPWSRRSLTAPTLLSPLLLSSFCQLDTAALFGSRLIHSFGCLSLSTTTFSTAYLISAFLATAHSHTTNIFTFLP